MFMKKLMPIVLFFLAISQAAHATDPLIVVNPVLTTDQKKVKVRAQMDQMLLVNLDVTKNNIINMYKTIWSNKDGLTPQQVFDLYGTNAAALRQMLLTIVGALNTAAPGTFDISYIHPVTVNPDGTITVP